MRVLVVNAGSTSLKLRTIEADGTVAHRADLGAPGPGMSAEMESFWAESGGADAVGHRVVHGGTLFDGPVVVDDQVRDAIAGLAALAPLHNPPAVAAIDSLRHLAPDVPAVACFDTAFHHHLPPEARTYALPTEWVRRWGLRRYGFHGLSCEWATARAQMMLGRGPDGLRLVVCHLGGGASVTAVSSGRSVDTTMGFTPAEGLVMATRSGDVDPGLVAWLGGQGVGSAEMLDALETRSGLLALSEGLSSDMRALLRARRDGIPGANLAVATYLHRLRAKIAAMAAAMDGLDALVFTGGVGEHSADIRGEACDDLAWMGVRVDPQLNEAVADEDSDITFAGMDERGRGAAVRTLVVHAREEVVVADHCRSLLRSGRPGPPV